MLRYFLNEFYFEERNAMISQDFYRIDSDYPKEKYSCSFAEWVLHVKCPYTLPVDLFIGLSAVHLLYNICGVTA